MPDIIDLAEARAKRDAKKNEGVVFLREVRSMVDLSVGTIPGDLSIAVCIEDDCGICMDKATAKELAKALWILGTREDEKKA